MKKLNLISIIICFSLTVKAKVKITEKQTAIADSTKTVYIDPVCKMKVKPNSSKSTVYNKEIYYFCAEGCKQKFIVEPAKYIKKQQKNN